MSERSTVVLVDEQDKFIATEDKLVAHQQGLLHRAFSVMLYRYVDGELQFLLQKRAKTKYHCGGLWTNTCCSHPAENQNVIDSALARLKEELVDIDVKNINLKNIGNFIYRAEFDNGLTEHEYDHVLIGEYNGMPNGFNKNEIDQLSWVSVAVLNIDVAQNSHKYTPWFTKVLTFCLESLKVH